MTKKERIIFFLILGIGIILRILILDHSFSYDEMYSVKNYFMHHSVIGALAKYNLPNNHFLNTVLGNLVLKIFPLSHYSVRFLPFLFGIGFIIVAFYSALLISQKKDFSFFCMMVASFGFPFVEYSAMARGYIYQCFFSLLALYFIYLYKQNFTRKRCWIISCLFGLLVFSMPLSLLILPNIFFYIQSRYLKIYYFFIQTFVLGLVLFIPSLFVFTGRFKSKFDYDLNQYLAYLLEIIQDFNQELGFLLFLLLISSVLFSAKRLKQRSYLIFIPCFLLLVTKWISPFFRSYIFLILPILILGLKEINFKHIRWLYSATILLVVSLCLSQIFFNLKAPGRNYRNIYKSIMAQAKPGDYIAGFYSNLQTTLFYNEVFGGNKKIIPIVENKVVNIYQIVDENIVSYNNHLKLVGDQSLFLINDVNRRFFVMDPYFKTTDFVKRGEIQVGINHLDRMVKILKLQERETF